MAHLEKLMWMMVHNQTKYVLQLRSTLSDIFFPDIHFLENQHKICAAIM